MAATPTPTVSIPQTAAAGGLLFTQPPQTAAASYYKIAPSNPVTFGWNFTSVLVYPTSLTIQAYCQSNGNTYPIGPTGSNGVLPGRATEVVWDPYEYDIMPGAVPLAAAEYTLRINDDRGANAPILGGYLTPYTGTKFSLYRPQQYTPLESWSCPGCSAAIESSPVVRSASIALFATVLIMFLSGFNLLRRIV
ncbi:hypothetical protein M408DRAFT_333135 [Serendipita vermifera MAFF 305830]|uniref:DUF7137 domain-containing protein n=1 Tax=Serendipita vermifera MAFF 305830 TaxID=933852 RepID=A0A0C2WXD5_SERVB|nr:hypothetical protein M408DRAFT_333135 [Serendipita vermifera MAFF 305830]